MLRIVQIFYYNTVWYNFVGITMRNLVDQKENVGEIGNTENRVENTIM